MKATWTRRGFVGLGTSALLAALAGCASGGAGRAGGGSASGSQGSGVVGGVETDSTSRPDPQASAPR